MFDVGSGFLKAFDNVRHFLLSQKLKALNLNPYLSFLKNRKQHLVFRGKVFSWHCVNKGTTLLFINDLNIDNNPMTHLIKYADDTTIQVNVNKSSPDISQDTVNQYLEWSEDNCIPCNVTKCNELCMWKRCKENSYYSQAELITAMTFFMDLQNVK